MTIYQESRNVLSKVIRDVWDLSSSELLEIQNVADTISYIIKVERRKRDARAVDEACALKERT